MTPSPPTSIFFFLNDPAPTEIYPLPLHDPLPISGGCREPAGCDPRACLQLLCDPAADRARRTPAAHHGRGRPGPRDAPQAFGELDRSEEHTSELQSPDHLVCRLLLEKKKKHMAHH